MYSITLDHPVDVDSHKYTSLTMRRPKVRDLKVARKVEGDALDQDSALYANLCEVSLKVIDELDPVDFEKLDKKYEEMIPERPQPSELRMAMGVIAREYGQPFSEIENLEVDEFVDYLRDILHEKSRTKEGK